MMTHIVLKMSNLHLYCLCYKHKHNKLPLLNQSDIMCGAAKYDTEYKNIIKESYILDDTLINISDLNHIFGQLTGLYWVWKNTNHDYVGTNTYRLIWNKLQLTNIQLQENTIYTPTPFNININSYNPCHMSIYDQFAFYHGKEIWSLLYGLTHTADINLDTSMIDNLKNETHLYLFNMFIAEKKLFDKICELLFDILFTFYNTYKNFIDLLIEQKKRILDFLGERILHILFTNKSYYFGNHVNIQTLNLTMFNLEI